MQRLLKTMNYNFVLYGIAAAAVLYTVTSRTVTDAILNFCFAGIIPGTEHVIPPDTMIMGVTIVLGLIVNTTLIAVLIRSVTTRRAMELVLYAAPKPPAAKLHAASPAHAARANANAPSATYRHKAKLLEMRRRNVSTRAIDYAILTRIGWVGVSLMASVSNLGRTMQFALLNLAQTIVRTIWIAVTFIARIAVTGLVVCQLAWSSFRLLYISFWAWLQPHAFALDRWLEMQCMAVIKWSADSMKRYEPLQLLGQMVHESRIAVRQLFR